MDAMDDGHGDVPFKLPRMGGQKEIRKRKSARLVAATWTIKGRATCWIS
jgi:hypothetical protein